MARERGPVSTGVLLVDKPKGPTSHDIVRKVRRAFQQREVGHTGTLDPMATGLLVLTLGKATRLGRYLEATKKRYTGEITLGRATDSFDAEGETTEEAPVPELSRAQVEAALSTLTGVIDQPVPVFSAVKVGGERLHKKARRGESVEVPVRQVEISSLRCTAWDSPQLSIEAEVSKGTYIRSLAVQIGAALGLPAHLSALRRTHVGPLSVEAAASAEQLQREAPPALIPMREALSHLPAVQLDAAAEADVRHGRQLLLGQLQRLCGGDAPGPVGQQLCLLDGAGALIAMAERLDASSAHDRALRYGCVLAT